MKRTCLTALTAAGLLLAAPQGHAFQLGFNLFDHPDGGAAPPSYGLRFDDLFREATSGFAGNDNFTWSFAPTIQYEDDSNTLQSVSLSDFGLSNTDDRIMLIYDSNEGGHETIRIMGHAFGGRRDGTDYWDEIGLWEFDFVYSSEGSPSVHVYEGGPELVGDGVLKGGTLLDGGSPQEASGATFNPDDNIFEFYVDMGDDLLEDPMSGSVTVTDVVYDGTTDPDGKGLQVGDFLQFQSHPNTEFGNTMLFDRSQSRLDCPADGPVCDLYHGEGWVELVGGDVFGFTGDDFRYGKSGARDFLFLGAPKTEENGQQVPEPATLALFGLGLLGLGWRRRART